MDECRHSFEFIDIGNDTILSNTVTATELFIFVVTTYQWGYRGAFPPEMGYTTLPWMRLAQIIHIN